RLEPFLFEPLQDEEIDGIGRPGFRLHLWYAGPRGGDEGPVLFVFGALGDPAFENGLLRRRQMLVAAGRRHHLRFVVTVNALDDSALLRLARRNGPQSVAIDLPGTLGQVQTQPSLGSLQARTMAGKALVRQDWSNLAVEIHLVVAAYRL